MRRSKRPSKPKPPSGQEKQNQLDLFYDWAKRTGAATAAALAAAKEGATRKFEEINKRLLSICGMQCALVVACSNRPTSQLTVIVVVAAALSVLLLVMPWITGRIPSYADRAARSSSLLATALLIVSVVSMGAEIAMPWLSTSPHPLPPTQHESVPKVEPAPVSATPDEKSLTEEAQREAAARAEIEAARVADCLLKEDSTDAARRTYARRQKDFARCRTEYETAFTLKGLDAYCGKERRRLDAAGRALEAAVANMCSTTGSTSKSH